MITVKPLVWEPVMKNRPGADPVIHSWGAETPFWTYRILVIAGRHVPWNMEGENFTTLEAAQAYIWGIYEPMIRGLVHEEADNENA